MRDQEHSATRVTSQGGAINRIVTAAVVLKTQHAPEPVWTYRPLQTRVDVILAALAHKRARVINRCSRVCAILIFAQPRHVTGLGYSCAVIDGAIKPTTFIFQTGDLFVLNFGKWLDAEMPDEVSLISELKSVIGPLARSGIGELEP